MIVFGVAWVKRRRRAKEILARWSREEAEEDRLRELAAAQATLAEEELVMPQRASVPPRIERDGGWHTLH